LARLKHLFLFVLLLSNIQNTTAQQNRALIEKQNISIDETVFIHVNATTFISGETLYYKLNCLKLSNKTASTVSKIAYVELVDSDKKTVFKNKIFLENSKGQGDYFVPASIKTGNYKLIGYTNWMLNNADSPYFEIDMVIINPFQLTANQTTHSTTETTPIVTNKETQKATKNEYIKLNLNKKIFSNREQVNVNIESLNDIIKNGNYSFSVRKSEDLPLKKQITATEFSTIISKTPAVNTASKLILPELRGEMIMGRITSKDNTKGIQNIDIGLSIPGKTFVLKVVKTDKNGNFIFNLDKPYYNTTITIQVIENNRSNYTLVLDSPPGIEYSKLNFQPNIKLTSEYKESLTNRSISSQIENAYYSTKTDSLVKPKPISAFYEPIAKEYILDDYTRFPTLKETATEIVKEMYYEQDKKNYSLHLRDFSIYTQSSEPALVLVDGLLLQNTNELFEYKMIYIYKISVVSGLYFLGPKAFNGVISFTTINQDYVSNQSGSYILDASIIRPSIKKEYFTPNYSDKSKLERIPDYRYQLLWLPEVTLENTENPISFYTSDVTGTFEILLEGFSDQGIPVSLKDTFEVQ
jgi:hypothetical protein